MQKLIDLNQEFKQIIETRLIEEIMGEFQQQTSADDRKINRNSKIINLYQFLYQFLSVKFISVNIKSENSGSSFKTTGSE